MKKAQVKFTKYWRLNEMFLVVRVPAAVQLLDTTCFLGLALAQAQVFITRPRPKRPGAES